METSSSLPRFALPLGILALMALTTTALLALPLRLPLGPNYWDLYTYVDAAYRMSVGQVPHIDFFVPVGSLNYVLYAAVMRVFPSAQTLLAVHYAILIVALPLMAVVVASAADRSPREALALTLPFVFFALIPINGQALYPSPGFDGYGNYNRHTALLLYVLAATLLFVERRGLAAALAVVLLGLLFMVKVTGLVVGLGMVVHAMIAGRLSWRGAAVGSLVVVMALGAVEMSHGLVSAYVEDIATLITVNTGFLLPRVLTLLSTKLDVVAPLAALGCLAFWLDRRKIADNLRGLASRGSTGAIRRLADSDAAWILSLLVAGAVFETQNTGSHEFILLWPAILRFLRRLKFPLGRQEAFVLVLAVAATAPTVISIAHRAARTVASAAKYQPVNVPLIGPIGRVSAKPEILRQARMKLTHYPMARASDELFAKRGLLPSYIMFSEIDFQVSWLLSVQEAAEAILAYEAANGKFFRQIATMDFVDPLPVMLKRTPLRDMSIGNDPDRTLMKLHERAIAEIALADAILIPKCPVTFSRNAITDAYTPSLVGRRLVALTPCFTMLVKD